MLTTVLHKLPSQTRLSDGLSALTKGWITAALFLAQCGAPVPFCTNGLREPRCALTPEKPLCVIVRDAADFSCAHFDMPLQ